MEKSAATELAVCRENGAQCAKDLSKPMPPDQRVNAAANGLGGENSSGYCQMKTGARSNVATSSGPSRREGSVNSLKSHDWRTPKQHVFKQTEPPRNTDKREGVELSAPSAFTRRGAVPRARTNSHHP